MIRTRRSRRPLPDPAAEARRVASVLARTEGWEVLGTADPPGADPADSARDDVARVIVTGPELGVPCLLRVCERRGPDPADLAVRVAASSEHVAGVIRELPVRRLRGREWEAVLLQHALGGRLDRVLLDRSGLRGGEAATILLGVAEGLSAMHRNGWARPGLGLHGVVFVADGCPALDELDAAVPCTPQAAVADAEAFYALARDVCLKVTDGAGMTVLGAVERGLRQGSWAAVESQVLSVVSPEPVVLDRAAGVTPARVAGLGGAAGGTGRLRVGVSAPDATTTLAVRVLEFLDGEPVRAIGRHLAALARRRPAVVAVGLAPIVAAIALVGILPAAPAESATTGRATPTAGPTQGPRGPAASAAGAGAGGTAGAAPPGAPPESHHPERPTAPTTSAAPSADRAAAETLASDDPVVAAPAVLAARHVCFTARSVVRTCLDGVLDTQAAFAGDEIAALAAGRGARVRDYSGASFSLIERWGAAALVAVVPDASVTPDSEPASLLLVRSEAGWRLRAVYP